MVIAHACGSNSLPLYPNRLISEKIPLRLKNCEEILHISGRCYDHKRGELGHKIFLNTTHNRADPNLRSRFSSVKSRPSFPFTCSLWGAGFGWVFGLVSSILVCFVAITKEDLCCFPRQLRPAGMVITPCRYSQRSDTILHPMKCHVTKKLENRNSVFFSLPIPVFLPWEASLQKTVSRRGSVQEQLDLCNFLSERGNRFSLRHWVVTCASLLPMEWSWSSLISIDSNPLRGHWREMTSGG